MERISKRKWKRRPPSWENATHRNDNFYRVMPGVVCEIRRKGHDEWFPFRTPVKVWVRGYVWQNGSQMVLNFDYDGVTWELMVSRQFVTRF